MSALTISRLATNIKANMARDWLPPALAKTLSAIRHGTLRFTGAFSSWAEAEAASDGYDADGILAQTLTAHEAVRAGKAAFQRDGHLFEEPIMAWPVLSTLLWAAARSHGELRVLDIGGGFASSYFQHRHYLADLPSVAWRIVEQPNVVSAATGTMDGTPVEFYPSIDEALSGWTPNVILLSSSLQYFEAPDELLGRIRDIDADAIIFDRTPFHDAGDQHHLVVQRLPTSLGGHSYPCWILSRPRVQSVLSNWQPITTETSAEGPARTTSGIDFEFAAIVLKHTVAR